jgi:hypothetical protein
MRRARLPVRLLPALILLGMLGSGCGLNVRSPDLFLLTRAGEGGSLTLLVNDGGTIRCDGAKARPLADSLLIRARDLATALDGDAKARLRIAVPSNSVYRYTIRLQNGTISFPDTAASGHQELAQAELFAVQVAQQACRLSG